MRTSHGHEPATRFTASTIRGSLVLIAACLPWLIGGVGAPQRAPRPVAARAMSQAGPRPSTTVPRTAISGVGRGFVGNVGRPEDGHGDDGDLVRGRLPGLDHAAVVTPTTQADNVVVDRRTGRMWIRRLDALDGTDGAGARGNVRLDQPLAWQAALEAARTLVYAGHDDWRLPSVHELDSLVDFGHSAPALDPHAFPEPYDGLPSAYFWSATTSPSVAWQAFYVNVRDGHRYPWGKGSLFSVRPVRAVDPAAAPPGSPPSEVAILRTGQVTGYVGDRGQEGVGNGDDGDLRPGEERDYDVAVDGAVDTAAENVAGDRVTRLRWIRDPSRVDGSAPDDDAAIGGNVDLSAPMGWQTAVDRCAALRYAGFADWRLPHVRELDSLMQPGRPGDPFDPTVFAPAAPSGDPERPASWWSSTTAIHPHPDQRPQDGAWYVDASHPARRHYVSPGDPPAKGRTRSVRCVRDDAGARGTDAGSGDPGGDGPSASPPSWLPDVRGAADVPLLAAETGPDRWEIKWLMAVDATLDLEAAAGSDEDLDEDAPPFAIAFQNTRTFPLHLEFLVQVFPERFGGLDATSYDALVGRRATRALFAGTLQGTRDASGGWQWGWDVAVADDTAERLTRAETEAVHRRLARVFRRRPLAYAPRELGRLAEVLGWDDRRLPVRAPESGGDADYEAYTPGIAYGTVRLLDAAALALAAEDGRLGRHDIVIVTDAAPPDLEQVVAGLVTGAPQGALSHLAVRAARRGTPNAFVRDAEARFAPWRDQLVRVVLGARDAQVAPATPAEAAAWWAARRPAPVAIAAADTTARSVLDLDALGAYDAGEVGAGEEGAGEPGGTRGVDADGPPGRGTARYGGKASNLARLYRFLDRDHQVSGLAVPFAYYAEHMARPAGAGSGAPAGASLAQWVAALALDPAMADGAFRAARLDDLREAIRDVDEDEALVATLATRIETTFGANVMVRFRSSSNAEDGLRFNGAGLYDSTSVCVADTFDDDKDGPSRCDPNQPKERTIQRGLRKVWASLYTLRAWEERDWYGIPQTEAAMAVLITPAFPNERANGVAFTGDPARPDAPWMLVSAQAGDTSVVAPEPGTLPERSALLLGVDETGASRIDGIRRLTASTLVPAGETVLSDAELLELGAVLIEAQANFPVDRSELEDGSFEAGEGTERVLLDLELKKRRTDGALLIKQVRPFLPSRPETGVLLVAPRKVRLCGLWRIADPIEVEHAGHVELDLAAGETRLGWTGGSPAAETFAALRLGPERIPATPVGPTETVTAPVEGRPDLIGLTLRRTFTDPRDGAEHGVALTLPALRRDQLGVFILDETTLTEPIDLALSMSLPNGGRRLLGPCGLDALPRETLQAWSGPGAPVPFGLRLELRKADAPLAPYQWADLVGAEVRLGETVRRVADLARLSYDAQRHNWDEQFLVALDPPQAVDAGRGVNWTVAALRGALPSTSDPAPDVALLGPNGSVLATIPIAPWLRQRAVARAATLTLPWLAREAEPQPAWGRARAP